MSGVECTEKMRVNSFMLQPFRAAFVTMQSWTAQDSAHLFPGSILLRDDVIGKTGPSSPSETRSGTGPQYPPQMDSGSPPRAIFLTLIGFYTSRHSSLIERGTPPAQTLETCFAPSTECNPSGRTLMHILTFDPALRIKQVT